jgi:hypothetical protein
VNDSEIHYLAAKLAEQMKQPAAAAASAETSSSKGSTSSFLWGAATAAGLFLATPLFRGVVRQAVRGGLRLGIYAKEVASSAKEELEDITAEAKAEMFRNASSGKDNTT